MVGVVALALALLVGGCAKPTYEKNLAQNMINDAKAAGAMNKPDAASNLSTAEKQLNDGMAKEKKYDYAKAKSLYEQAYKSAKKSYELATSKECTPQTCKGPVGPGKTTGTYTVVKGDCLWKISGKSEIYNDPFQWPLIYDANRDQIDKKAKSSGLPKMRADGWAHWIFPGQVFNVPQGASMDEIKNARKRAGAPAPYTPPGR
jgi:nucleoid-associated protein YgaU